MRDPARTTAALALGALRAAAFNRAAARERTFEALGMLYSMKRIDAWDFTHCDPGRLDYDGGADLFLSGHYAEVIAVEELRRVEVDKLVKAGLATPSEDRRYVTLGHDRLLAGWQGDIRRLTSRGRMRRCIVVALRREQERQGRVRVELGAAASTRA